MKSNFGCSKKSGVSTIYNAKALSVRRISEIYLANVRRRYSHNMTEPENLHQRAQHDGREDDLFGSPDPTESQLAVMQQCADRYFYSPFNSPDPLPETLGEIQRMEGMVNAQVRIYVSLRGLGYCSTGEK